MTNVTDISFYLKSKETKKVLLETMIDESIEEFDQMMIHFRIGNSEKMQIHAKRINELSQEIIKLREELGIKQ